MAYPRSYKHLSRRLQSRLRGSNNSRWLVAGLAVGAALAYAATRPTPSSLVLALDLSTPPAELNSTSFLSPLTKPNHWEMIRVLEHAAQDKAVRGIVAHVGGGATPWTMAQAQEIRQASQRDRGTSALSAT